MAVGIVQEIKFNVSKTSKAGKTYTVTQLKYVTEKGALKTESCFSDCSYADVLKGLAAGDKINATYVKNGEFFNLTDVSLIEKGTGVAPTVGSSSPKSYDKSPETQAAIIRQNALTNAVHFMTADVVVASLKGDKAKLTADDIADMTLNMARKFERYTSGKDVLEALQNVVQDVTSDDIPD
jgi:hypothetical protein